MPLAPTSTTPDTTLLNIHTWGDVRAFLHSAAPAIAGVLLGTSAFSTATAQIIATTVALIVAITDASLSTINTASGFRRWLYPVLAAAGAALAVVGVVTDAQWAIVTAIVPILLGGGVAGANTDTTATAPAKWVVYRDPADEQL